MTDSFPKQPKGIKVKQFNDHITIEINWFYISDPRDIIFTYIWYFIGYLVPFSFWIVPWIELEFIMILLSIPFLIIANYLLYINVKRTINKTFITVNDKAIVVRDKPFPTNNTNIKLVNLQYIFHNNIQRQTISYYQVYAKKSDNGDEKIIESQNREHSLFIEKTLKDYLNLEDEPKNGELDRVE